jgi:hypothetical protein
MIDKGIRTSHPDSKVRAIASSLILAALSRIKDPLRKRHIIRFLLDSGLNARPGMMINLSEAGLDGAYLIKIDLHGLILVAPNSKMLFWRGPSYGWQIFITPILTMQNIEGANDHHHPPEAAFD